jgi:Tol biopolymer transport system component
VRRNDIKIATTKQMKSFHDAINFSQDYQLDAFKGMFSTLEETVMQHRNMCQAVIFAAILLCNSAEGHAVTQEVVLDKNILFNATAYIPPQCYTITAGTDIKTAQPCYVCHTKSIEPNYRNDQDLQLEYSFPESARINPWTNLFEQRKERIATLSDDEILSFIRKSNYLDEAGQIIPAKKLHTLPTSWDYNKNNSWDGYTPDCFFNFDDRGFDRLPDSGYSGWRAFGYHPFPATYWPTNGATDDVMIRLPKSFRQTPAGAFDRITYEVNLAIVESLVSRRDIAIEPTDEKKFGIDLNQNGRLDEARQITHHWPESNGKRMSYVGAAGQELRDQKQYLAAGLFPVGTEFLHSIRYLDISDEGEIHLSARMKELQYMQKNTWQTYADLEESALSEMKERDDFPDRTSQFIGNAEHGVYNGSGWLLQGFIEDAAGALRPQSFEETVSCVGCHGGIGATTDSVFAFSRKLGENSPARGWFHWDKSFLHDIVEPKTELYKAGVFYEYSYYLMYNASGNDLRDNPEVISRFTLPEGSLNSKELLRLQGDVSRLLLPSPERALQLNKAYRTIVLDQDFIHGREVYIDPVATVHKATEIDQRTTLTAPTSPVAFGNHFGPPQAAYTAKSPAENSTAAKEVLGASMIGPDGQAYIAEWSGIIHKSSYNTTIDGARMVFPDRLTLPTRPIIPTTGNASCTICHRRVNGQSKSTTPSLEDFDDRRQLTTLGNNHTGRFSPDGSSIAFVSDRSGSDQIWLMDNDGRNQRQLTSGPMKHSWPNWRHDSRQLVFIGHNPAENVYAVKSYSLDDKTETILVSGNRMMNRPTYHPADDLIAYSAQTGTNWDIWLTTIDGRQQQRLTTTPNMESNPLWSPDGKMLAYKVAPADAKYSLTSQNFLTFANGYDKPTVHLWQGPESVQMSGWSPDGQKIGYTAETISGSLGKERVTYSALISDVTVAAEKATTSHTLFAAQGKTLGDRGPVFSPDGRFLAFWAWNRDYSAGLWLYDIVEKQTVPLPSAGLDMYPMWSPDSKTLLYEANQNSQSQLQLITIAAFTSKRTRQFASR